MVCLHFRLARLGRTGGRRGIGAGSFRIIFGQVAE
jgi:hypothetical protein